MINNPGAYPKSGFYNPDMPYKDQDYGSQGMTMLDHYAGLALQSILNGIYTNPNAQESMTELAKEREKTENQLITDIAYSYALAMLRTRKDVLTIIERENATK